MSDTNLDRAKLTLDTLQTIIERNTEPSEDELIVLALMGVGYSILAVRDQLRRMEPDDT